MMRIVIVGILAMTTVGWGQANQPSPPPPTLTATTQIALQSLTEQAKKIAEEQQALQRAFTAIDNDVRTAHPGWHLSPQTLGLEKDQPIPVSPTSPTKK